jgi:hypothetical protein
MAADPSNQVSLRVRIARSWWLASELARRNRKLYVYEYHPGGGQYDCLALVRREQGPTSVIDLNRAGRLHVHQPETATVATWLDVVNATDPHQVVKALERAARLQPVSGLPTTPELLTYRVIARVLASVVDDRHTWDARCEAHDTTGGMGSGPCGYLEHFPRAGAAVREFPALGRPLEPDSHVWALLRDDEPVALLDIHGTVYTRTATVDLMPAYRTHGSNLTRTIATVLGDVLP